MSRVVVEPSGAGEFRVRVSDGVSETIHTVTLADADYARLTSGRVSADELVRRSFEFLLEREPKESILPRFDLMVIARYFPEYEGEMRRRLG
jgi:hypothetical protein